MCSDEGHHFQQGPCVKLGDRDHLILPFNTLVTTECPNICAALMQHMVCCVSLHLTDRRIENDTLLSGVHFSHTHLVT